MTMKSLVFIYGNIYQDYKRRASVLVSLYKQEAEQTEFIIQLNKKHWLNHKYDAILAYHT